MSGSNKHDLLLLFDRPKEPLFMPKGEEKAVFNVPENFLNSRFRPIGQKLFNRFGDQAQKQIAINDVAIPDMTEIMELSRFENFSLFVPRHSELADKLIKVFMGVRNHDDLKSVAAYARDRLNPYLFNYALSVSLLHRDDTKELDVPSIVSTFPDKFIDGTILQQSREELTIVPDESRMPIVIPRDFTATDAELEHRLAYFREDLGVNLHHWHWHLVYPNSGPVEVVRKDRRGELFYYMHQQIISRYNFERLGNSLKRVDRLINLREPLPEAYFPKLNSLVASRGWPSRVAYQTLQNVNRQNEQIQVDIDDLELWRQRIFNAIHSTNYLGRNGQQLNLTEYEGIDVLGNMLEAATALSPNSNYYGNFHNMGHIFIAYLHDPDGRHLEQFGVMGDVATAMRDPLFYRWHSAVNDIFQEHKQTLPPYTEAQLNFQGISVTDVEIEVQGGKKNEFSTFWMQSDVNLSRGMDFSPRGPLFVRFTHLNHRPFSYKIQVNNQTGQQRMGTCRVFMAPKKDETGRGWLFREQRHMMTELDKFTVTLKRGANLIIRRSTDSSITIPFERTFRDLDTNRPTDQAALNQFNFCGCGWPQHMLIPRGTPEGFPCELFVMITNYEDDKINQTVEGQCNEAYSFCGIKDKKYPDRRPMGYPFDRLPSSDVTILKEFLTPNMRVQDVTIKLNDEIIPNPRNKS